ncbi:unnamed protein product [Paramecium primaurelia]|uniref:Uncharacterized protein n=1 Tax=Paramecium primaurelia TaxID=5886 RepID=A0A8S1N3Y3_PARPR|nr:unnamed protein product [Paramecium primaurelia]
MDQSQGVNDIAHVFKIILLGSTAVGKSQILLRFTKDQFNLSTNITVGVEFSAKVLEINNKKIRVQVWDTAGQEKYRAIAKAYYKGAVGAFLVYDITKKNSFLDVDRWLQEIREYSDQQNLVLMLIGNKNDLEANREVSKEEAIKYAQSKKMGFLETSAQTGHNIEFAFKQIAEEILRDISETQDDDEFEQTKAQYSKNKGQTSNASVLKAADHQVKKKNNNSSGACC